MAALRAPRLLSSVRRLARDEGGNVATIFVAAMVPVIALGGAALDYARASKARLQLRTAVDAAALAAAQHMSGSYTDRQQAALGALQANLSASPIESLNVTVTDLNTADGKGVSIDADGVLPTSLMKVVGIDTMALGAHAEALAGGGAAEIALVLDNTGSMINDMPALKAAASAFVNTVFASGSSNVKMSVVPYVATVNVGRDFPPSSLEMTGMGGNNGHFYRNAWVAGLYYAGCNAWVMSAPSSGTTVTTPSTPAPPIGSPVGQDKMSALDPAGSTLVAATADRARSVARSLFGISRAAAQQVTPNTFDPIVTTPYTVSPPYVPTAVTAQVPDGYAPTTICWLGNPSVISQADLFNRMPGVQWKGCVEARLDPYDLTDDPPTSDPKTHFVPYFAPDEPDSGAGAPSFDNNYISDIHSSWVGVTYPLGWDSWSGLYNMMRYDGVNVPTVVETGPTTSGPNYACPDPLLRLTNVKADVLSKIASLNYWNGGGTVTSEGLAWGWRTISPNAPFAQGSAYGGQVKKYIVLMTDGMNSLVENRPNTSTALLSDYTAYGYLIEGRMTGGTDMTFSNSEAFLNTRMNEVCHNAKAKGISIFTILFRETDPTITSLLQSCASSPTQALKASDAASLNAAFSSIASQVNTLRLSK